MDQVATTYRDLWAAVATVGAAVWLVTFAIVGFATSNEALRNLGRKSSARFTMYYAAFLTGANVVAPVLAALHWLSPVGGRPFVDGGVIVADALAWGLVALSIVGFTLRPKRRIGRFRQALLLSVMFLAEVSITWQGLFGAEG